MAKKPTCRTLKKFSSSSYCHSRDFLQVAFQPDHCERNISIITKKINKVEVNNKIIEYKKHAEARKVQAYSTNWPFNSFSSNNREVGSRSQGLGSQLKNPSPEYGKHPKSNQRKVAKSQHRKIGKLTPLECKRMQSREQDKYNDNLASIPPQKKRKKGKGLV